MERQEVILRPRPVVGGLIVTAMALGLSAVFLYRHDTWYEWALGVTLAIAWIGFVAACLWRHFSVVTREGFLRVDWFGFRRRFIPVTKMNIAIEDCDTSYGLLSPDLEIKFSSPEHTIGLRTHLYSKDAVRAALDVLEGQGVSAPMALRDEFKRRQR